MKGLKPIFTLVLLTICLNSLAQDYEDLIGNWLVPDRNIPIPERNLSRSNPEFGELMLKRANLLIEPDYISYIPGSATFFGPVFGLASVAESFEEEDKNQFITWKVYPELYNHFDSYFRSDTMVLKVRRINVEEVGEVQEREISVVFESPDKAYFKVGPNEFIKLSRNVEPGLEDYMTQFDLKDHFPQGSFSTYYPKIQQYSTFPLSFTNQHGIFFRSKSKFILYDRFAIFPNEIHFGNHIWEIAKVFHFKNCWISLAENTLLGEKRFFIFTETDNGLTYSMVDFDAREIENKEVKAPELLIKEKRELVQVSGIPSTLFRPYYYETNSFLDFFTLLNPLTFKPSGELFLNGREYKIVRAYKSFQETINHEQASSSTSSNNQENSEVNTYSKQGESYYVQFKNEDRNFLVWMGEKPLVHAGFHSFEMGGYPYDSIKDSGNAANIYVPLSEILIRFSFQLLMIIIPLIIAIFLFYRTFVLPRRLKNRLTTVQFEGVKSQLNPHFLFNSMASIQSLMNQGKIKEANRYFSELSDLLRYHLDTGAEELVPLSEELSAIEHYCELEKLRSPFDLSFEVDERIDPDRLEIPNQLLQPIVENAIKHGLRKVNDPKLRIRVQQLEKSFSILIEDNGPGIGSKEKVVSNQLPTSRKTHKGMGLVREKISLLKKRGIKVKFAIEDRVKDLEEMESGTKVSIELPLNY